MRFVQNRAIETPVFIARQADSHESLEFEFSDSHEAGDSRESCEPIRANHATTVKAVIGI